MEVKEEEEPVTILQPCPNSSFLPPKLTRNDGGKNIPYRFLGAKLHRMGNTMFFWGRPWPEGRFPPDGPSD